MMRAEGGAELSAIRSDRPAPRIPNASDLLTLSLYWFPSNLFWTIMLQYALPHRVQEMVGESVKGTYLLYISALGAVATTVVQLIVGPISDACGSRMGRRHPFILWGTILGAACILLFAYVQSFWLLVIAFFGVQTFLNLAMGPYQALLPDTVPASRHGLASAYMGFALLIGQLAGGLTLFGISQIKPAPSLFAVLSVVVALMLAGAVVTVLRVPDAPAPPDRSKPPLQALRAAGNIDLRGNPDFFGLLYSRFFINLSFSTVTAFLLYYLQDSIGPKKSAVLNQGLVILVATVAGLIGTALGGKYSDKVPKKRLVYVACAILATGALFFAFITTMPMVLALAFVFGAGWGTFAAVDWALAVNLLPEGGGSAARYLAVWHVCLTLPQVFAPCFGPVADRLNGVYGHGFGWRAAMLSTVVYLAVGALLLRRVRERAVIFAAVPSSNLLVED